MGKGEEDGRMFRIVSAHLNKVFSPGRVKSFQWNGNSAPALSEL